MLFAAGLDPASVLAYLEHCYLAVGAYFVEYLLGGAKLGEGTSFSLVGKNYVHIAVHNVVQESVVALNHIVGCHI